MAVGFLGLALIVAVVLAIIFFVVLRRFDPERHDD